MGDLHLYLTEEEKCYFVNKFVTFEYEKKNVGLWLSDNLLSNICSVLQMRDNCDNVRFNPGDVRFKIILNEEVDGIWKKCLEIYDNCIVRKIFFIRDSIDYKFKKELKKECYKKYSNLVVLAVHFLNLFEVDDIKVLILKDFAFILCVEHFKIKYPPIGKNSKPPC